VKILVLTPYLSYPPDHGGRIRSHQFLSALSAAHAVVNVTGFAPHDDKPHRTALEAAGIVVRGEPLAPRFGRLPAMARLKKIACLLVGASSLVPRWRSEALAAIVRAEAAGADVTVMEHVWMASYLRDIGSSPLVFSTQNVESDVLDHKAGRTLGLEAWMTRREAAALRRTERRIMERAALTIAVSKGDAGLLQSFAPGASISVIDNGVDLVASPLLPPIGPGTPRLLYLGGYDYHPNAVAARRLAEEILPRVRASLPGAEAILAGRDPAGVLQDLAGHEGVIVAGRVEDLGTLYERITCVVTPLTYGGGSRLKILEALAFGRPVVTTPEGADGLAVEDREHVLMGRTSTELADAVIAIHQDTALRDHLRTEGRRYVEAHHGWPALRERFVRAIEGVRPRG
jgi:glycosyltransferase involved in cell wall biosynthesis